MVKVVFFYNEGTLGFSETWYNEASTPIALDLSKGPFATFLKASLNCRASAAYIYGARVSNVAPPKLSNPWFFGAQYAQSDAYIANPANAPDVVSTDAEYLVFDGSGNKRQFTFRAIPDSYVAYTPSFAPIESSYLSKAVSAYFKGVIASGLQFGVSSKAGSAGYIPNMITSIEASPANPVWSRLTLTTAPAYTIGAGNYVLFHGINKNKVPGFPTKAQVMAQNAGALWIDIPYLFRGATAIYNPTKASVIPFNLTLASVSTWQFQRFSERKTGRPFGVLRGRARSVVRAQ